MRIFGITLLAMASSLCVATAAELENPYKNAQVGDTLTYKISVKNIAGTATSTLKQIITEKTEKEVTIKSVTKVLGKEQPAIVTKIDLTKDFDPVLALMKGAKAERLKFGLDKVKVGEKEYGCFWASYKIAPLENSPIPIPIAADTEVKVWLSKDVPGVVKMTSVTKVMNFENSATMQLLEYVSKK